MSSHRYSIEQLQKLRFSPLVNKPGGLLPVEEWMGPATDPNSKRTGNPRGKSENYLIQIERTPLESRQFPKAVHSPSENIVLGPPRMSFASSSAQRMAPSESHNKSAFGSFGDHRGDYFSRGKFGGDRSRHDNLDDKLKDPKPKSARNGKDEQSQWLNRQTKGQGGEDDRAHGVVETREQERSTHDNGKKYSNKGFEGFRRDGCRENESHRRTDLHQGNRPSWYQEENMTEGTGRDSTIESQRYRGWRNSARPLKTPIDREQARSSRLEQEPEWMEDAGLEQKKEKHNARDIEQWKASMKALELGGSSAGLSTPNHVRLASGSLQLQNKKDLPLSVDPSLDDRFLSFFESTSTEIVPKKTGQYDEHYKGRPVRNQKSSKFTGFFSPQALATPVELDSVATAPPISDNVMATNAVNDDQAGFQRILEMLGAPQASLTKNRQTSSADPTRPDTDSPPKGEQVSILPKNSPPPILSPRSRRAHDIENLLGMQSPRDSSMPMNKESEFLLNLLRPKDHSSSHVAGGTPNGVAHISNGLQNQETRSAIQDSSVVSDSQHAQLIDETNPSSSRFSSKPSAGQPALHHSQQRPFQFDDGDDGSVFPPQFAMGVHPQTSFSSGIHLPSSFEHALPPPGFPPFPAPNNQQQHRGAHTIPPPPGFGITSNRNFNHGQFPPGLIPSFNNLHVYDRPGPPYSVRSIGGTSFINPPPSGLAHGNIGGHPSLYPMPVLSSENFLGHGRPPPDFGENGQYGPGQGISSHDYPHGKTE